MSVARGSWIYLKGCRPIFRPSEGPFVRDIPRWDGPYCVIVYH